MPRKAMLPTHDDRILAVNGFLDNPHPGPPRALQQLDQSVPSVTSKLTIREMDKSFDSETARLHHLLTSIHEADGCVQVLDFLAHPDEALSCILVDLSHLPNLVRAFVQISLVDTYSIDPKRKRFISTTQILEGNEEVLRHSKTTAIESGKLLLFDAAPGVK
jgi:hypothetical protein